VHRAGGLLGIGNRIVVSGVSKMMTGRFSTRWIPTSGAVALAIASYPGANILKNRARFPRRARRFS
jgi:hypothetical protein